MVRKNGLTKKMGKKLAKTMEKMFEEETKDMTPEEKSLFLREKLGGLKTMVNSVDPKDKRSHEVRLAEMTDRVQAWKDGEEPVIDENQSQPASIQ